MNENIYDMLRAYNPHNYFFSVHSKWDQIRPIRLHEITKITLFMLFLPPTSFNLDPPTFPLPLTRAILNGMRSG